MKTDQIKTLPTSSLDFICLEGTTEETRTAALEELLSRLDAKPSQLLEVLYCDNIANAELLLPAVTDALIAHPHTTREDLLFASENSYGKEARFTALKHLLELGTKPDFVDDISSSIYELDKEELVERYVLIGSYKDMEIHGLIAAILSTETLTARMALYAKILRHPDTTLEHFEIISCYTNCTIIRETASFTIMFHEDVAYSNLHFVIIDREAFSATRKIALLQIGELSETTPENLFDILRDLWFDDKELYDVGLQLLLDHPDSTLSHISRALKVITPHRDTTTIVNKYPDLKLILDLTSQ